MESHKINITDTSEEAQAVPLNQKENNSTISLTTEDKEPLLMKNGEQVIKVASSKSIEETNIKTASRESIKLKGWKRYIGIMFALTASMVFALASLIVKMLTKDYDALSVAVWRFLGIFWPSVVLILVYAFVLKEDVFAAFRPIKNFENKKMVVFLIFRCIFGCSAVTLQVYSLIYIGLADSSVISFSTPVFVTFVAYFFLKEALGITPIVCALLTICGIFVISRPPFLTGAQEFDRNTLVGIAFAFCSMTCSTFAFVLLRRIRHLHYALVLTFFGFFCSVVCLLLTTVIHPLQIPQGLNHWLLTVALGILTFIGHGAVTLALKFEQAGPVSLIRTSEVIFAFIWQGIILAILPDIFSILGACIVITGVVISGLRKWVGDLPEHHPARIKLKFLLT